jgi:hypothetical protein
LRSFGSDWTVLSNGRIEGDQVVVHPESDQDVKLGGASLNGGKLRGQKR